MTAILSKTPNNSINDSDMIQKHTNIMSNDKYVRTLLKSKPKQVYENFLPYEDVYEHHVPYKQNINRTVIRFDKGDKFDSVLDDNINETKHDKCFILILSLILLGLLLYFIIKKLY